MTAMPRRPTTRRAALKAKGFDADIALMDVTDSGRVSAVADELVGRYGKVDILVNNAGIARSETPAETVTDEHWLNVIDVNLNGTFWCCRAFGNQHAEGEVGNHRQCRLDVRLHRQQAAGTVLLQRLKAAVHHLTKSLAAEWARAASASTRWRRPISRPR